MTSTTALALMAKAMAVFGGDDTFLSFPLTPISFTKKQLDFLTAKDDPSAALENASQFAHIVNQIPNGPVWPTVDTGPIWQEYSRILKEAQLSNAARTAGEEAQYQAAIAFLYVTDATGLRSDAPAVIAYRQFRDAYLNARQQYTSRKIAADASTDAAVKAQWENDGPVLQAAVAQALAAWLTQGAKSRVDDARRVEASLGAKSPSTTWSVWATNCDPDIVALTDLETRRFFPTGFAPSSAIDSSQWQNFSLSASEIEKLVSQAPKELAARLGDDQPIDIDSIDFECTSVTITRPWFAAELFSARFWKLNSTPNVVSDGSNPASGTIPGYTVAIVFARNPEVKLKASSPPPSSDSSAPPVSVGPLHVASVVSASGARFSLLGSPAGRAIFAERPPIAAAVEAPATRAAVAMASERAVAHPNIAGHTMMQLRMVNFERIPAGLTVAPPADTTPAPTTPPAQTPVEIDEIFVLGFICKRVPMAPNPDPALPW